MARAPWLEEDDAILAEIWKHPAPVKTQLDRFPGRTEDAIRARAAALNLPDRRSLANGGRSANTFARIEMLVKARPGTVAELASRACVSKATVQRFIEARRSALHISTYRPRAEDGYAPAVWSWGAGDDAVRPPGKSANEISLAYYRRIRRNPFFRAKCSARARRRYAMKTGKWVRRDPAAVALFGPATPDDDSGA